MGTTGDLGQALRPFGFVQGKLGSGQAIDRFFSLIQSLFLSRSESAGSERNGNGSSDAASRARPPSPDRSNAPAASTKTNPADSRVAPRDSGRAAGETVRADEAASAVSIPTEAERIRAGTFAQEPDGRVAVPDEVRRRLDALLVRLEAEPADAWVGELLKILALLARAAGDSAEASTAFYEALGPEFEGVVSKMLEVLDATEGGRPDLLRRYFRPSAFVEGAVHEDRAQEVRNLVRTLAGILEQSLKPVVVGPLAREGDLLTSAPRAPAGAPSVSPTGERGSEAAGGSSPETAAASEARSAPRVQGSPAQVGDVGPRLSESSSFSAARVGERVAQAGLPPAGGEGSRIGGTTGAGTGNPRGEEVASDSARNLPSAVGRTLSREPIRLSAAQVEMVERIVRMAHLAQGEGGRRLQIRLNPPMLGHLRMDLSVREGTLVGHFHVETLAARSAVLSQLEALRAALSQEGVQVGSFQVSVEGQERPAGSFDDAPGRGHNTAREERAGGAAVDGAPEDEAEAVRAKSSYVDVRG